MEHPDALGWEAIFYFVGTCGCIWFLLWVFLAYNTPADHPRISAVKQIKIHVLACEINQLCFQTELKFIEANVQTDKVKKLPFPPFKKIFTSSAYWGLQIAHIGGTYGFFALIAAGPTYLKNVHHVTIEQVTYIYTSKV